MDIGLLFLHTGCATRFNTFGGWLDSVKGFQAIDLHQLAAILSGEHFASQRHKVVEEDFFCSEMTLLTDAFQTCVGSD